MCTAVYDNVGQGIIYRVTDVIKQGAITQLKVKPVFGVITDPTGRRPRSLGAGWCTPLSIVDLATEYTRFGLFIGQEAKRLGAKQETDAEEIPARNDGDVEGREDDVDGAGLCADISSRDEMG